MKTCTVIGSGPSGVHFAQTALEKGYRVEMIDVGMQAPADINPEDSFQSLKSNLPDPASYFLGNDFEGVLLPGQKEEFYGVPPSKNYAQELVRQLSVETENFNPFFSFARGGLAQMWTGGCYPFNDAELEHFQLSYAELAPYYEKVATRIGINGTNDDLSQFIPHHTGLQEPLPLDDHSQHLVAAYQANRNYLQQKLGCYLGRARQSVLSRELGSRKACQTLGRCLWGCPTGAFYTPSITLDECLEHPNFSYHSGQYVSHFDYDEHGLIRSVVTEPVNSDSARTFPVESLVLAGGSLGSSKIFLESIRRKTGQVIKLQGLMDNRQVLIPFLNLRMIGHRYQADSYQYNQLAMGLKQENPREYVHGLITTLKTAMIHPVLDKFPLDLRTSLHLFRGIHAALGVVNVNFHDTPRAGNFLSLGIDKQAGNPALLMHYSAPEGEAERIARTLKRIKKSLWKLGCIVPPGMVHIRPMGSSVHYAGTIPMSNTKKSWTADKNCRSHDFPNLYFADGVTFPFLPAKNLTFTLMANAIRVAEHMDKTN